MTTTAPRARIQSGNVVGAPLLFVTLLPWRHEPRNLRALLWYIPPSIAFLVFRWPGEDPGGETVAVVAGVRAARSLARVCAQRTKIAAVLLVSTHDAFGRVVHDDQFLPLRTD